MGTRIAEDVWNSHKAAIQELYVYENGTLGSVMQELSSKGFHASKAQYERQFKKWGYRKNKKKEHWEAIAHEITKRKRDNKESEVMVDGEAVPSKRLRKEISRYGYSYSFPHMGKDKSPGPSSDRDLMIYTPPPDQLEFHWPSTLPWLQFEHKFLRAPFFNDLNILSGSRDIAFGLLGTSSLMLQRTTDRGFSVGLGARKLCCLMPQGAAKSLEVARTLFNPSHPSASTEALKILLFALSNSVIDNLGDRERTTSFAGAFVRMLADYEHRARFNLRKEPSILALLEKCYQTICISGDLEVLELCLKMGMSPNQTMWLDRMGDFLKPIQLAALYDNWKQADLLIRHGANVNATSVPRQPSALSIAFLHEDSTMARILIGSGADIVQPCNPSDLYMFDPPGVESPYIATYILDASPLDILVSSIWDPSNLDGKSHIEFLQEILQHAARNSLSEGHREYYLSRALHYPLHYLPSKDIIPIIRALVSNGGNMNADNTFGIMLMLTAARCQDSNLCATLLSMGSKPCLPPTSGYYHYTPAALHCAALWGRVDTVQTLIAAGAEVNHYVSLGRSGLGLNFLALLGRSPDENKDDDPMVKRLRRYHTPIQFALATSSLGVTNPNMYEGKEKVIDILLSHGAMLCGGELANAVEFGDLALVKRLHQLGASLDDTSASGRTPLQQALYSRCDDIVVYLVEAGAKFRGREVFDAIINWRPIALINFLKVHISNVDLGGMIDVFAAGNVNNLAHVLSLWPTYYSPDALCAAVVGTSSSSDKSDFLSLVDRYLERNTTNLSGDFENMVLVMAIMLDQVEIQEAFFRKFRPGSLDCILPHSHPIQLLRREDVLRKAYASTKWLHMRHGSKALRCSPIAATMGKLNEDTLRRMLRHGFRPDTLSVLLAVHHDRGDLLKILLESGADPNHRYSKWDTALQMALREDLEDIAHHLLELGADINAHPPPAPWGLGILPRTALQHAVENGTMDIIPKLLDAGADVNAPAADCAGATALQLAAGKGFIGIAKLLIQRGANVNADGARVRGRTALEIAAEHGRIDMLQFLLDGVPKALTDGEYAPQYIRAIRRAEHRGHMAAAMILRDARAWDAGDDGLYEEYKYLGDDVPGEADVAVLVDNLDDLGNRMDYIPHWEHEPDDSDAESEHSDYDTTESGSDMYDMRHESEPNGLEHEFQEKMATTAHSGNFENVGLSEVHDMSWSDFIQDPCEFAEGFNGADWG